MSVPYSIDKFQLSLALLGKVLSVFFGFFSSKVLNRLNDLYPDNLVFFYLTLSILGLAFAIGLYAT